MQVYIKNIIKTGYMAGQAKKRYAKIFYDYFSRYIYYSKGMLKYG